MQAAYGSNRSNHDTAECPVVLADRKPIQISLMKDGHDGMSNAFRELLESPGYSIFYHAPTVIMVEGKTESQFQEID